MQSKKLTFSSNKKISNVLNYLRSLVFSSLKSRHKYILNPLILSLASLKTKGFKRVSNRQG